ncbi:hypothetical protein ACBQ54_14470 [Providencia vermicola]|uniref:hypothetical protein n=1 Tax=Providencia vermicola TaxID=333965 RepID=UPI003523D575
MLEKIKLMSVNVLTQECDFQHLVAEKKGIFQGGVTKFQVSVGVVETPNKRDINVIEITAAPQVMGINDEDKEQCSFKIKIKYNFLFSIDDSIDVDSITPEFIDENRWYFLNFVNHQFKIDASFILDRTDIKGLNIPYST